ncbi:MAG: hypothetical protein R3D32_10605 [Nitratireductor sp.]
MSIIANKRQKGPPPVINPQKLRNLGAETRPVPLDLNRKLTQLPYDDKLAKLEYLVQMIRELRLLSATIEEPTLAYLLEMAVLESDDALRLHELGQETGKSG